VAVTAKAKTLASYVYTELRRDILNGRFQPGERLKPTELGVRFGVSTSVVREALSRLAEQPLVRQEDNQGFRVAELSEKDLTELTTLRVMVETYALRLSIEQGDFAWESQVVAAHHLLSRTRALSRDDPDHTTEEWSDAHRAFHRALIAACDMPILLGISGSLFDASELYRRMSVPFAMRKRNVASEHRELCEAALGHDTQTATTLLETHFQRTTAILLENMSQLQILEPE
jgi:DNA-binding GntR family transcriptional regulator